MKLFSAPRITIINILLAVAHLRAGGQVLHVGTHLTPQFLTNTLSVSATPANVSFQLASTTTASASQPVTISTSWNLSLLTTVHVYAFFSSSAALSDGGSPANIIPASAVLGQCSTGSPTGYTAFTQNSPFAASTSLLVFQQSSVLALLTSRSDQLNLRIDLHSLPELPAGTYSGTLLLQAQAF